MKISIPFLENETGLGEAIKKATNAVGIKPCGGCTGRARTLDKAIQFVPTKNDWTRPPEVPEGWTLIQECQQAMWFQHSNGKHIVWELVDNEYRNSHSRNNIDDAKKQMEISCQP